MINLRTALRNALATWRQYRADRDEEAILQRVDAYNRQFDLTVARARAVADRLEDDEREPAVPLHPLTHQRRESNPRRRPARISLDDAALRLIEGEDTGQLPRHLAATGWGQR